MAAVLCNSATLQWRWSREGRFPPSVNNAVARLLRQVATPAWKAAPQLEPRVSFQLLGGKRPAGLGAQAEECIQVFWTISEAKDCGNHALILSQAVEQSFGWL